MPASSINLYHMQDTKNNFNAVQLAPICADTDALMGQCQTYHVSTNCYYGFHGPKVIENIQENNDSEMADVDTKAINTISTLSRHNNSRKRSAEDFEYPQTKRLREEVQTKKCRKPETIEKQISDTSSEDLMETLYWNLHGGNFFQLLQYDSSICSLVGTRSSPNHSASAFNINISTFYIQYLICGRLKTFCIRLYAKSI